MNRFCGTVEGSGYGVSDYISDIDAFLISIICLEEPNKPIYEIFEDFYNLRYHTRYIDFYSQIQSTSEDVIK